MNNLKTFINYLFRVIKNNILSIIALIVVILFMTVKLPYSVYAPGGTINVQDRLSNMLYESKGSFNLTYVTSYEGNLGSIVLGLLLSDWDVIKNEEILVVDDDLEEMTLRETISMYSAISTATFVAYQEAGVDVNIKDSFYYIYHVYKDLAETDLETGDRIISFDGSPMDDSTKLTEYIQKKKVGSRISFRVMRNNEEINCYAIVKDAGENLDMKVVGILVSTIYNYENDPDIHYSYKPSEIGSSGGLMLTLSIYNALTENDLTNGLKISGTGTIEADGSVGEIGGVTYKINGAVHEKSDIFIVPEANYKEAKEYIKKKKFNIKLIKAENIKQVIEELEKLKEK